MASTDFLDFRGRAVLITGAATGIGRAVAAGFASLGAKVAIGDINEEAARETLDLVSRAGGEPATWEESLVEHVLQAELNS